MNKTLIIKSVSRVTSEGIEEKLTFKPGVNTIIGPPNAGKTKWLQMLDYSMGDVDSPEDALGADIVEKYEGVTVELLIDKQCFILERKFKEKGRKGKVAINGELINASDFSGFILNHLQIPVLHYPKGNPYSERSWPELSWRNLLRHVYRQEKYWSDLADKQPEFDQFACIMQFLGLADLLFPQQLGSIIEKRKRLNQLEAKKEQFQEMLMEITKDIIKDQHLGIMPTKELIDLRIIELSNQINLKNEERKALLQKLSEKGAEEEKSIDLTLGEKRFSLINQKEINELNLSKLEKRIHDLVLYSKSVKSELDKMQRTIAAGHVMADLKVTHCPVCDKEIKKKQHPTVCYLCGSDYINDSLEQNLAKRRIEFELAQLQEENKELDTLIAKLKEESLVLCNKIAWISDELSNIDNLLRPIWSAVAAISSPELSVIDLEIGQLIERREILNRVRKSIDLRDEISVEIDAIGKEIATLQTELDKKEALMDFETTGDILADGINTYLGLLNKDENRWKQGGVSVKIKEKGISFLIGGKKWDKVLGGTLRSYFLMACHYSLLNLNLHQGFRYPGLCIIDFPPTLTDTTEIIDGENYLLRPFVELLNKTSNSQLIAAGRAFANLEGAHKIELLHVYSSS